jgi:hypothetical protein
LVPQLRPRPLELLLRTSLPYEAALRGLLLCPLPRLLGLLGLLRVDAGPVLFVLL